MADRAQIPDGLAKTVLRVWRKNFQQTENLRQLRRRHWHGSSIPLQQLLQQHGAEVMKWVVTKEHYYQHERQNRIRLSTRWRTATQAERDRFWLEALRRDNRLRAGIRWAIDANGGFHLATD